MNYGILVVDDEQDFLDSVKRSLRTAGFRNVYLQNDPTRVVPFLEEKPSTVDIALIDITMPGLDGVDLLGQIKETSPFIECIMISALNDAEIAVNCLKRGAYDYLVKPVSRDRLVSSVKRAIERRNFLDLLNSSKGDAPPLLHNSAAFKEIVTTSPVLIKVLKEAELHAMSDIPILITGESGTGKDLLAQAICRASTRSSMPFTAVNMSSLTSSVFDAEFFGHTRGAFTGAVNDRKGYLEETHKGTLFMDEIGIMPLEFQGKLLRVLQTGEYIKLGTSQSRKVDIRFIAATNTNIEAAIRKGTFREDFYYRLKGAWLYLPPLRERREDIPLLVQTFLKGIAPEKDRVPIEDEVIDLLMEYEYPGNIRELQSIVHAAANLGRDKGISVQCLPAFLQKLRPRLRKAKNCGKTDQKILPLSAVEKAHIMNAYQSTDHNKVQTADLLQIGLNTLRRKLKSYGVS